jgi:hypothetical protein
MSKQEQPPPPHVLGKQKASDKRFNVYPFARFVDVAQTLYTLRTRAERRVLLDDPQDWRWSELARQAFSFLDRLATAHGHIAEERRLKDSAYCKANQRSTEADMLPEVVPYDRAIRFITGEDSTKKAKPKFERFISAMPRYFGQFDGKPLHQAKINSMIKHWRAKGMTRYEAMELQSLFEQKWHGIIASLQSEKAKKGGRRGPDLTSALAELARPWNENLEGPP